MKCPNCRFVCSDLRDLCPQCTFDLRAQKKAIGVKVSNPNASYEELLKGQAKRKKKKAKPNNAAAAPTAKAPAPPLEAKTESELEPKVELVQTAPVATQKPSPEIPSSKDQPKRERPGLFARLFSKPKPSEQSLKVDGSSGEIASVTPISAIVTEPSPAAPTETALIAELPEQPKPAVLDLSNDENMLQTLEGMYGDSEIEVESVSCEGSAELTEEIEFEVEFDQTPAQEPQAEKVVAAEPIATVEEVAPLEPHPQLAEVEPELPPIIEQLITEAPRSAVTEITQNDVVMEEPKVEPLPVVAPEVAAAPPRAGLFARFFARKKVELPKETIAPTVAQITQAEDSPKTKDAPIEQPLEQELTQPTESSPTEVVQIEAEIPKLPELEKGSAQPQLLLSHTPAATPPPAIYLEHLPMTQSSAGAEPVVPTEEPHHLVPEEPSLNAASDSDDSADSSPPFAPEFAPGILDETLIDQLEDSFPEVPITPDTASDNAVLTVHADREEQAQGFVEDPIAQEHSAPPPAQAVSASALEQALARDLENETAQAAKEDEQEVIFDDATIQSLFQMMMLELDSHAVDVELQFENLAPFEISDEILVLFDMAEEVMTDPDAENRYLNTVPVSAERHVETHDLEVALERTEAEMNPTFSLATGYNKKKSEAIETQPEMSAEEWHKHLEEELGSRLKEITIPSIWRRVGAFVIDQSVVAILAAALALGIATESPHRAGVMMLLLGDTPNFTDALVIYGLMASFFILLTPLVPLLSTFLFKKSLGFLSTGLTLYKDNGTRAEWQHLCLRSALFPLSALCFGYIPILTNGRGLHDLLSKTVVGRRRGLAQARKAKAGQSSGKS